MEDQKILYANGLTLSITGGEARLLFTVSTPIVGEGGKLEDVKVDDVVDIRVNDVVLQQISETIANGIDNYKSFKKEDAHE